MYFSSLFAVPDMVVQYLVSFLLGFRFSRSLFAQIT